MPAPSLSATQACEDQGTGLGRARLPPRLLHLQSAGAFPGWSPMAALAQHAHFSCNIVFRLCACPEVSRELTPAPPRSST